MNKKKMKEYQKEYNAKTVKSYFITYKTRD